jgi:hypothetical protein
LRGAVGAGDPGCADHGVEGSRRCVGLKAGSGWVLDSSVCSWTPWLPFCSGAVGGASVFDWFVGLGTQGPAWS